MMRMVKRTHVISLPRWRRARARSPRPAAIVGRATAAKGISVSGSRKLFFLSLAFILGLLIGVLVMRGAGEPLTSSVEKGFTSFVAQRQSQSFGATFLYSFTSAFPFFAAAFVCGLCMVGTPGAFFIPCFRGLGLGLTLGYLYAVYGMKGMAFSALLVIPAALVSAVALLLACRETWGFSLLLFKGLLPDAPSMALRNDCKIYCLRYLFILGVMLFSCLMDAGISLAFIRFFSFA